MNNTFTKLFVSFLFLFSVFGSDAQVTQTAQPKETKFPAAGAFDNSNLTYKIISSINKTYCYDIFADGKLLIHQPSVPGLSGNEGFKTSQSAEKVAQLVIKKIKNGEMPPTVSIEEMKKLKAIK
jgi:hypothetical protein